MKLYQRNNIWWVSIVYGKNRVRQSLKTSDYDLALINAENVKYMNDCYYYGDQSVNKGFVTKVFHAAKYRANKKGVEFKLTKDELNSLFNRANGACEVTGVKFDFSNKDNFNKRPFVPSIDRINSSGIYELKNCRIVCMITNIAMNEWGEEAFKIIAHSYIKFNNLTPQITPQEI